MWSLSSYIFWVKWDNLFDILVKHKRARKCPLQFYQTLTVWTLLNNSSFYQFLERSAERKGLFSRRDVKSMADGNVRRQSIFSFSSSIVDVDFIFQFLKCQSWSEGLGRGKKSDSKNFKAGINQTWSVQAKHQYIGQFAKRDTHK